jgi:hypothetical protein
VQKYGGRAINTLKYFFEKYMNIETIPNIKLMLHALLSKRRNTFKEKYIYERIFQKFIFSESHLPPPLPADRHNLIAAE